MSEVAMRQIFLIIAFVAAIPPAAVGQTEVIGAKPGNADERVIIEMMRSYYDARSQRDASALDRLLADDFTGIPAGNGAVRNKSERIRSLTDPDVSYEFIRVEDVSIRFYGKTALLLCRVTMKGTSRGQSITTNANGLTVFRSMLVYVKRGGRWQIVAAQGTYIPQE